MFCLVLIGLVSPSIGAGEWQPEWIDWWQKHDHNDVATWKDAVETELWRSLEVYPRLHSRQEVKDFVTRTIRDTRKEDYIFILDNKLYVDRDFIRIDKNNRHLQMVYSVASVRKLPDVVYLVNRFAFGDRHPYPRESPHVAPNSPCYAFRTESTSPEALPEFELVIAKFHGYKQCGVMIPNMYNFNELGKWNATGRTLLKAASKTAWSNRKGQAFWRGQILAQPKCHRDSGNYARWQALALARIHPEEFECDCLDGKPCAYRNDTKYPCVDLQYNGAMRALHLEPRAQHSKPAVPFSEFLSYKMLLNLPGTISGSYSRHLNVLWGLGSVLLLWNSPHVEWYYPILRHGITHQAVDPSSVLDIVRRIRDDPDTAARLTAVARSVYDQFLCADCVADYFQLVLRAVNNHFSLGTIFTDSSAEARAARAEFLGRIASIEDGRQLLQVQFSSTQTLGESSKPGKSIPYMFLRDVSVQDDKLVEEGDWRLSNWVPGRGA